MPAMKIEDALLMLRSAFPKTQFQIKDGTITFAGGIVAPGLIAGTPVALVRTVAAQLKAIEQKQEEAAHKAAEEAGNAAS